MELDQKTKEKELNTENNSSIWRPVMMFYAKTTSWVIFPLILAIFAGRYVSKSTRSQVFFFLFILIGFGITLYGIYREIQQYKKDLE